MARNFAGGGSATLNRRVFDTLTDARPYWVHQWIRPNAISWDSGRWVFVNSGQTFNSHFIVKLHAVSGGQIEVGQELTSPAYLGSGASGVMTPGSWHSLLVEWLADNTIRASINGTLFGSGTSVYQTNPDSSQNTVLFSRFADGTGALQGDGAESAKGIGLLSGAQKALLAAGARADQIGATLLDYVRMKDDTGTTENSVVGGGIYTFLNAPMSTIEPVHPPISETVGNVLSMLRRRRAAQGASLF